MSSTKQKWGKVVGALLASFAISVTGLSPVSADVLLDSELSVTNPGTQLIDAGPLTLVVTESSDATPTFVSDDDLVCEVTSEGVVTVVSAGVCSITVSLAATDLYEADSVIVSFTIDLLDSELSVTNPGTQLIDAGPLTLVVTESSDANATFSSSTMGVCTVDASGEVTFVAAGECSITVSLAATDTYASDSVIVSFMIENAPAPAPAVSEPTVVVVPQPVVSVPVSVAVPQLIGPAAGRPVVISTPPAGGVASNAALAVKGRQVTVALTAPSGGAVTQYVITFRDRVTGKKFTVVRKASGGEISRGRIQLPRGRYQVTVDAKLRNGKTRSWSGQGVKVGK